MKALSTVLLLLLVFATGDARAQETAEAEEVTINEQEAKLSEMLTGATLHGFFTVTRDGDDDTPPRLRGERYDLVEVRKVDNKGNWLFKARIRYGDHDVTLPMTLPVKWAGDTPVVVVDNIGFPGLGTYSARVLFHAGHYAGHWNGADHGGNLFGTIEKNEEEESEE
ncbi:hypothetical protein [Aeoliella sp.]|uniref:hypothetical protein n=1 Tax=Aeoliella sp. TaxID=2795800 RepID=UPI003CCC01B5